MPIRIPTSQRTALALLTALSLWLPCSAAPAQSMVTDVVVEAREALRKKDGARLAQLRERAIGIQHPLAQWVDYWELGNRLAQAQQPELDAFYARWSGTTLKTACATTGCSNLASAAIGPTSRKSSRAFA